MLCLDSRLAEEDLVTGKNRFASVKLRWVSPKNSVNQSHASANSRELSPKIDKSSQSTMVPRYAAKKVRG